MTVYDAGDRVRVHGRSFTLRRYGGAIQESEAVNMWLGHSIRVD